MPSNRTGGGCCCWPCCCCCSCCCCRCCCCCSRWSALSARRACSSGPQLEMLAASSYPDIYNPDKTNNSVSQRSLSLLAELALGSPQPWRVRLSPRSDRARAARAMPASLAAPPPCARSGQPLTSERNSGSAAAPPRAAAAIGCAAAESSSSSSSSAPRHCRDRCRGARSLLLLLLLLLLLPLLPLRLLRLRLCVAAAVPLCVRAAGLRILLVPLWAGQRRGTAGGSGAQAAPERRRQPEQLERTALRRPRSSALLCSAAGPGRAGPGQAGPGRAEA
jgi:hypothetical protein